MREPGRSRVAAVESLNMNVIIQENPPEWRTERHFFACLGGNAKQYAADVRNESRFPPSLRVQWVSHIPAEKRQSDLYSLLDGRASAWGKKREEGAAGEQCRRARRLLCHKSSAASLPLPHWCQSCPAKDVCCLLLLSVGLNTLNA